MRAAHTLLLLLCLAHGARAQGGLTKYVDPFVGTGGHGHTFPGATRPFGMVQLSPDTRLTGWDGCSGYHYSDTIVYGFSHTHLSGTGISDYGDILLMPTAGEVFLERARRGRDPPRLRLALQPPQRDAPRPVTTPSGSTTRTSSSS